eukprot:TRINITY_DN312_c0_g1_i2.p6 TRINITY_DN312_c0_g1~~TRINITY_DN312_c0_g1_i2.p6  ORF type:complete len:106 (-),score=2.01 TRINITY_DN312_c0_g1_i2:423-740(-)
MGNISHVFLRSQFLNILKTTKRSIINGALGLYIIPQECFEKETRKPIVFQGFSFETLLYFQHENVSKLQQKIVNLQFDHNHFTTRKVLILKFSIRTNFPQEQIKI